MSTPCLVIHLDIHFIIILNQHLYYYKEKPHQNIVGFFLVMTPELLVSSFQISTVSMEYIGILLSMWVLHITTKQWLLFVLKTCSCSFKTCSFSLKSCILVLIFIYVLHQFQTAWSVLIGCILILINFLHYVWFLQFILLFVNISAVFSG